MNFCRYCGTRLTLDGLCPVCQAMIIQQTEQKKRSKRLLLGISIGFVALVCVIIGVVLSIGQSGGGGGGGRSRHDSIPKFVEDDYDEVGTCGEDVQWGFKEDTGELVIIGTGEMKDYDEADAPWSELEIKSASIYGVTSIGHAAFMEHDSLTEVTIGDSVTYIGALAFAHSDGLTEITLPDNLETIEFAAFSRCDGLSKIVIPDSVTTLGSYAFSECSGLTEVIIGDGVTIINEHAFEYCYELTHVTFGNNLTTISLEVFRSCENLTDITFPDSLRNIGDNSFSWCSALTEVTIPESMTYIGSFAFSNCENLTDVYYEGTDEQWYDIETGLYNSGIKYSAIHFNS